MQPLASLDVDILLIGGLQGSGKSSLATSFFRDRRRINRDDIRAFLKTMTTGQPWRPQDWTPEIEPLVTEIEMATLRHELAAGKRVVIDNTLITPELRAPYVEVAQQLGKTIGCLFLALPLEACRERNQKRDRIVPDHILSAFAEDMVPPAEAEGLDMVRILDRPVRLS